MPTHGLILTAAGASTRFGPGVSKVLRELLGVPVLVHAARAFREALGVTPTVVTVRAGDVDAVRALVLAERSLAGALVLEGGDSRQASVARGLGALPAGIDIVLVHDAARPLVSPDLVRRVAEAAARDGAAVPALPLTDSVHRRDEKGRLVETLPREALRAVQTPQAARIELLRQAFRAAAAKGLVATDEVGLLIAAGTPVTEVPGEAWNRKLTEPADLAWAEAHLRERAKGLPRRS